MAINSVASGSSTQATLPKPPVDKTRQVEELAKQAEQAKLAKQAEQTQQPEEAKPKPVVNTQGQTTGSVIDTVA